VRKENQTEGPRQGDIRDYRDLIAWQKARGFVKSVYESTRSFPTEEVYGLTNQMRRAAVSAASNIAEGYGRGTLKDYLRFLQTARGSLYELQTQILLAGDLSYLPAGEVALLCEQCAECSRVLQGLIKGLRRTPNRGPPDR